MMIFPNLKIMDDYAFDDDDDKAAYFSQTAPEPSWVRMLKEASMGMAGRATFCFVEIFLD